MRFTPSGGGWDQFPSDDSIDLIVKDRVAYNLRQKALVREAKAAKERIRWLKNRRVMQAQNLARRKAERETVENVSGAKFVPISVRPSFFTWRSYDAVVIAFVAVAGQVTHPTRGLAGLQGKKKNVAAALCHDDNKKKAIAMAHEESEETR